MALHDPPLEIKFLDENGYVNRAWAEWLIIAKTDKADKLSGGTEDNIATIGSDGNISDSGKDLPTGDIIGTSDTQTLTNKTLTSPTITGGTQTSPTIVTPTIADLSNMTHDHTSASGGGDYPWADMTQAATQADVSVSTSNSITDPSDSPVSADDLRDDLVANTIPSIEALLNAIGTEINSKFNALIDKLQAANLMT